MSQQAIDSLPPPFVRVGFPHPQGGIPGIFLGKNAHKPDLVFLHANGFCASTYLPLLAQLHKSGLDVLALDIRAQGRNTLPADQHMHGWQIMREDHVQFLQQLDAPPILAGHSLGATISLLTLAKRPELARGVIAFDPPMLPRMLQWLMRMHLVRKANSVHPLVRGALARRREFQSREYAFQRYCDRFPFAKWEIGCLSGYLLDGLKAIPDEQMQLACAPEWEAQIYRAHAHDIWGALKRLEKPAHIITGDGKGTVVTPTILTQIARLNPHIQTSRIEGYSHFLPMEDSDLATNLILAFTKRFTDQA